MEQRDASDDVEAEYAPLAEPLGTARSWPQIALIAGLGVTMVVLGVLAVTRPRDSMGSRAERSGASSLVVPTTDPDAGPLTPDEADALWDAQVESGWVPYHGHEVIEGYPTPEEAWIPIFSGGGDGDTGFPVYDKPGGEIVGYAYPRLGFVPPEIAQSPDFDPSDARIDYFGCDILDEESGLECLESRTGMTQSGDD